MLINFIAVVIFTQTSAILSLVELISGQRRDVGCLGDSSSYRAEALVLCLHASACSKVGHSTSTISILVPHNVFLWWFFSSSSPLFFFYRRQTPAVLLASAGEGKPEVSRSIKISSSTVNQILHKLRLEIVARLQINDDFLPSPYVQSTLIFHSNGF